MNNDVLTTYLIKKYGDKFRSIKKISNELLTTYFPNFLFYEFTIYIPYGGKKELSDRTVAIDYNNKIFSLEERQEIINFLEHHITTVSNEQEALEIANIYAQLKRTNVINSSEELDIICKKYKKSEEKESEIKPPQVKIIKKSPYPIYSIFIYMVTDPEMGQVTGSSFIINSKGKITIQDIFYSARMKYS